MKMNFLGLVAFATLVFFASCNKDNDTSDADLIEKIESASRVAVSESSLPASTKTVLNQDYTESFLEKAEKAEGLGYKLSLRKGADVDMGAKGNAYFNLDGRKLNPYKRGKKGKGHHGKRKCFELVFPVTLVFPDSTTAVVNDKEALKSSIRNWHEANPDADDKVSFQFPIQIKMNEDNSIVTINSREELHQAKANCKGGKDGDCKDKKRCFKLVFPITVILPDGTTVTGNNRKELKDAIRNWYQANPDATDKPSFQYPFSIEFEDGTTQVINSDEELEEAKDSCDE